MENYTQLGIAGITLAILFFIVRYFVAALNAKDQYNKELTDRFISLSERNILSHQELTKAIDASTDSNKIVAEATREGNDKLTGLMLKVIKTNGKR